MGDNDPVQPVQPVQPAQPVQPVQPVQPRDPAAALARIRDEVMVDIVAAANVAEIRSLLAWSRRWQDISNACEVVAQVFICIGIVLAFASGYFAGERWLAFAAGGVGAAGLAAQRFSAYAEGEGVERHAVLQRLLVAVGAPPAESPGLEPGGPGPDPTRTSH